ncbi:MAG: hypothetical protein IJS50_03800, partial [Desulfovibrio sp.]|nr:hypothetical protein [Desulfovibrio sp.]
MELCLEQASKALACDEVPVGALLPRLFPGTKWYHALLAGLCLTLLVEGLQWVLGTGEPDVDD